MRVQINKNILPCFVEIFIEKSLKYRYAIKNIKLIHTVLVDIFFSGKETIKVGKTKTG